MTSKYKKISPADVKPGECYCGYETIGENGKTIIKLCSVSIDKDGKPVSNRRITIDDNIVFFYRNYTTQERAVLFNTACDLSIPRNQLNLMGLHTDLNDIGDASHDGFNSWIVSDWKRQLANIKDKDFFIAGVAPQTPYGCPYLKNPVALVIEFSDTGSRVWYHADPKKIQKMRADSLEEYNALMAEK